MKTTKKNNKSTSATKKSDVKKDVVITSPVTKKTDVKKDTTTKAVIQPKTSEVVKTQEKVVKAETVLTYVTTFPRLTLKDSKEIVKLLKSEHKEVKERIEERKINMSDVVKLSKYGHNQLLNGKIKSSSMKFYLTMKNDKIIILNFRKY